MAFVTAGRVSRVAVDLLTRSLVLPMTVLRPPGAEFAGSNGDTITVRVRAIRTAREQVTPGAAITYDDIVETPVTVTLSHLYDATKITDEALSLEVADFAEQVTEPQVAAVATGAEDQLGTAMNALTAVETTVASAADAEGAVLAAREVLGRNEVPAGNRWLAVNPEFATYLLLSDKFSRVDASGSSSALRDAIIGRLYGFNIVETSAVAVGANTDPAAIAYHQSAFVWANRAPVSPRGAADSSSASEGGVSLRQIFDFDPNILSDRSVVSTFAGAALVDANRAVRIADDAV